MMITPSRFMRMISKRFMRTRINKLLREKERKIKICYPRNTQSIEMGM